MYDLQDHRPGPVLRRMYDNLERAEAGGDAQAGYFRRSLRILAAGGDGTVAWVLGAIADLRLDPPPRVAVRPPPLPSPSQTASSPCTLPAGLGHAVARQ